MGSKRLLSILIVNYNTKEHLRRCLHSLEQNPCSTPYEVLIIDNASTDGSAEMVAAQFPRHKLICHPTNDGYGAAINRGMQLAKGDWLMFLNPDIEVTEYSVDTLTEFAEFHRQAGLIGPRLVYSDGRPQPSARRFISAIRLLAEASRLHLLLPSSLRGKLFLGTYFAQNETLMVPWVSGACHLIPRAVWEKVGPLTEETFCGSDDYDYCYRVRQHGYQVWFCSAATMTHHCSVAVRQRWNAWEVEQVAIHNFYVILEAHWPAWRLKGYFLANILSLLIEGMRHMVRARHEQDVPGSLYRERLRRRLALDLNLLLGRQRPIHRFQPTGQYKPPA